MSNSNVKVKRTAKEEQLLKEYYDIKYKDWLGKDFSDIFEFQKDSMAYGIGFANFKLQFEMNELKLAIINSIPVIKMSVKALKKFTDLVNKKRKECAK